jgi:superfamily II DNA or RNA helicase
VPSRKAKTPAPTLDWRSIADKLWPNQLEALQRVDSYLNSGIRDGALVQMPTGTGKTAIISIVARLQSAKGRIVVVASPSAAVANQLRDDIGGMTWRRLGLSSPWTNLVVTDMLRSTRQKIECAIKSATTSANVIVGTLQALNDIRQNSPDLYESIQASASVILVDEGHKEPAEHWSESAEGLQCPMVLFSATPYRNDLRHFKIDLDYLTYKSFNWAVAEGLIRDVRFEILDTKSGAASFAHAAAEHFEQLIRSGAVLPDAKAIFRFESSLDIEKAAAALESSARAKGLGFVAVHETFSGNGRFLKSIPDLRTRSERIFLHQFKLTEGVDEPRCSVLYLHKQFGNERQLVQQVGRCVRRAYPRRSEPEPLALVVTPPDSTAKTSWEAYLEYDRVCEKAGKPPVFNVAEYGATIRTLGIPMQYAGQKFRFALPCGLDADRPIAPDQERVEAEQDFVQDVLVPKRCVVYPAMMKSFDDEVALVLDGLKAKERIIIASAKPFPIDMPDLHVAVCHVIGNSDMFARFSLVENHYAVTVIYRQKGRVYVFDSSRTQINAKQRISPADLGKLLPEKLTTKITRAATKNMDISPHAIRGREVFAASLRDSPQALSDFLGVLSRASGTAILNGQRTSRYVGFFTGRVSDGRGKPADLDEFAAWCDEIGETLDSAEKPAAVFERFARTISAPTEIEPRSILLEISQNRGEFVHRDTRERLRIEDYCSDIEINEGERATEFPWTFKVTVVPEKVAEAPRSVLCYLCYRGNRFEIHSPALENYVEDAADSRGLLEAINADQSMRILIGNGLEAYGYNFFYTVTPSKSSLGSLVEELLHTDPALSTLSGGEKGSVDTVGRKWDSDSIFGYIDKQKGALSLRLASPDGWDALICYRRDPAAVALFHAKASQTPHSVSAASLHEVLSQAIKNFDALRLGGTGIASSRSSRWDGSWKSGKRKVDRIRFGGKTGAFHLGKIRELLKSANTQRHVCIVTSGALKKTSVLAELKKSRPKPEATQAFLLLAAFYAESAGVGLIPTVICD